MTLDPLTAFLLASQLALAIVVFVRTREAKVSRRLLTLDHIAAKACAYAEQMGGEKLATALACAREMDANDNGLTKRGVRAFEDRELRIAVEAHLGGK